jgi:hypothetical protein
MATYDPPAPLGPARPQDRLPKLGTQFYFDSVWVLLPLNNTYQVYYLMPSSNFLFQLSAPDPIVSPVITTNSHPNTSLAVWPSVK